jgi:hypothetical protein
MAKSAPVTFAVRMSRLADDQTIGVAGTTPIV